MEFTGVKFHHDHRRSLPTHLKYSRQATANEYQAFRNLYKGGEGGDGFHECMNFSINGQECVKIYLPPTCEIRKEIINNEFVIFSFTYVGNGTFPPCIVGVHAGVKIVNLENGIIRNDVPKNPSYGALTYHAEARPELVTLFSTPIPYDCTQGIFTPIYEMWGSGRREIGKEHAKAILKEAYSNIFKTKDISLLKKEILGRELKVINDIYSRCFNEPVSNDVDKVAIRFGAENFSVADNELGRLGEEYVYQREIDYVKENKLDASLVEWISQVNPQSVFDIKTVRIIAGKVIDTYLEVKSSKMPFGENIYVSSRQIEFFEQNHDNSSFVFVNFTENEAPKVKYMSLNDVKNKFEFTAIKYHLSPKK
ncbi:MAG: hypothetical protein HQL07_14365 [Nitrospirae bacterium]|nr:hypothetical protein [Magnetococcales bacterium]HAT49873.1 hypothetical protein [Alphaproteobacteria bacterium]